MAREGLFGSSHSTSERSKQKRNVISRRRSTRMEKPAPITKNKHAKKRLNIQQAIDEALDDYSAEHIDEYSLYQSELAAISPVSQKPLIDKREESEVKRRHSFDVQTSKSPVLVGKKPSQVAEPLPALESVRKEVLPVKQGPTEADFIRESDVLFCTLFKGGAASTLPLKSPFSPAQEGELRTMLLQIVHSNGNLPEEEDSVLFYFSGHVLSSLLHSMRYESPYGPSLRSSLLESLASYDTQFAAKISHSLSEFLLQYMIDERALDITEDDFSTIQREIGGIHRYVMLLRVLTETFRSLVAHHPPQSPEAVQRCVDHADSLLKSVECLIQTRSGIAKYTEVVSSVTISLFSMAPSLITSFYTFMLRHWPRYSSEKITSFIDLVENLLAASPPLYLTPFLRDVVRRVFGKVCRELLGSQLVVSKRAAYFLQNYYLRTNYIAMDDGIAQIVKKSLTEGMDHWNEIVATACEKAFDMILDDL